MKGLLVRVGMDQTAGGMNPPICLKSGRFAYVPIPETTGHVLRPGQERSYDEFQPVLDTFSQSLPANLSQTTPHLDPDFEHLTYGDQGQRARQIQEKLKPGDFLAFYASLKPFEKAKELCYALIGLMVIDRIVPAKEVFKADWHKNAHTRFEPDDTDIVVFAKPNVSGRFDRAIPIGEFRNKAYRVTPTVLNEWGGLTVKDGFLQRSARLPEFKAPQTFMDWLQSQRVSLFPENNPAIQNISNS